MADNRPATARLDKAELIASRSPKRSLRTEVARKRPVWERRLGWWLHAIDLVAILLAATAAQYLQPVAPNTARGPFVTILVLFVVSAVWKASLSLSSSYGTHVVAQGPDEYRRVLVGSWHFAAALVVGAFLFQAELTRSFVATDVSLGVVLLFGGRHSVRRILSHQRRLGHAMHKLLVVGPPYRAAEIINRIEETGGGFEVVGLCTNGMVDDRMNQDLPLIGFANFGDISTAVARTGADTVAVVGESDMPTGFISQLAWELEGTGVDLMVSPAITDIAGPRIHIRPVAQLPMLYVESPHSRRVTHRVKALIDPVIAGLLLLLISPALLVVAGLIKLDSPGPVFFRQRRAGHNSSYFRIWKFRTMCADAERMAEGYELANELNEGRGKSADDPRITRLGRFLRKTSLDELPQLINVVQGTMSLVGPRPVPADLETFEDHELRRLLVRPGMTGLWQVSGRSDLDWKERVRLDLYYVENWSPLLDLVILLRTVAVVLRGSGAY